MIEPSLFIYRVSYINTYLFTEKAVREYINMLGLPSPNEVTIKRGRSYRDSPMGNDMIPYMVYVDWKLKPIGWIDQ